MSGSNGSERDRQPDAPTPPSRSQLARSLARLEEQQDAQTETLERIEGNLKNRLDEIEDEVEENTNRSTRHQFVLDVVKYGTATLSGGGVLAVLLRFGLLA